jgi:hypothetical protein
MKRLRAFNACCMACWIAIAAGCSSTANKTSQAADHPQEATVPAFHFDPATAGSISGTVRYTGRKPARKPIDMSEEPACVEAHHGRASDESLVVSSNGLLANAFIYVKKGLEGKRFDTPSEPAVIDQNGCWFKPRVLGIQTNQILQVKNSDPVTHNIHPMAQINREWNHSQGAGDAPLARKFIKPEIMIRVKCNIHSWMHAFIGVVDNPYFAVSKEDGTYTIPNLPPGTYTIEVWQENLGTQERQVTVASHSNTPVNITFKGK